ncbi:orotidine-5'-phosphate decarboxylase [cyanobiont of Ornithocercus magnificus]|nr:orotidine-5'-phosphate decarboxylase [cyanobiont of Ornithocercus magnificus]
MTTLGADRIIVALDGMRGEQALSFVRRIPELRWVKVGSELFTESGPDIVLALRHYGLRVFLDLKFHDIPTTMAAACWHAAAIGAELITVHACAGYAALASSQLAAIESAAAAGLPVPKLLAVTILTSWQESTLQRDLMLGQTIKDRVLSLAHLAVSAGIGGCVCSPLEVQNLRTQYPEPFVLVTPAIRLSNNTSSDQFRVMGPAQAVAAGASQLVIGRPITSCEAPAATFTAYCREIDTNH